MHEFPDGFLWGAATAGHQVEGGNTNSDCWAMEHVPGSMFRAKSGDAADFLHRYAADIVAMAALGLSTLRFSLEWSRIEPAEGEISRAALDHYRRVAATCHEHGVTTVVSFNHWTTPIWFAADGGWANDAAVDRFTRFVDAAAAHLAGEVDWACTLNEPNVRIVASEGGAVASPGGSVPHAIREATARHPGGPLGFLPMMMWPGDQLERYTAAHRSARDAIKAHADIPVGWTLAGEDYQAVDGGEAWRDDFRTRALTDWLEVSRDDDFVGVQNYTRRLVGPDGLRPVPEGAPVNDLGWELYPESLANVVRYAAEVAGVPVLVTEHGVATADDALRVAHTDAALAALAQVVADGVDLRGYLHWTLLDEYEWFAGYRVTFGLIEVDRQTFIRKPRPSAAWLGRVARVGLAAART